MMTHPVSLVEELELRQLLVGVLARHLLLNVLTRCVPHHLLRMRHVLILSI